MLLSLRQGPVGELAAVSGVMPTGTVFCGCIQRFPELRDDLLSQLLRLQHLSVLTEAHDPPLDLLRPVQRELGNHAPVPLPSQLLARVPRRFLDVPGDGRQEANLDADFAVAVEDAERLGQMLLEIEILGPLESLVLQFDSLDPVHLPMADVLMAPRAADQVERAAMVGQPVGPHRVGDGLGRLKRLVSHRHGLAVLDGLHERVDQVGLLRVVVRADHRLAEHRGELVEVVARHGFQNGLDLPERLAGGLPEDRAHQRLQQSPAKVQRRRLVPGEVEFGGRLGRFQVPFLPPKIADDLPEGKPGRLEGLQVAADRLDADPRLLGQFLDRGPVFPRSQGFQKYPLPDEGGFVVHGRYPLA